MNVAWKLKGVNMEVSNDIFDENWKLMHEELSGESERACAIVGVAYLDDLLGQVLENYLLENTSAYHDLINPENINAPLSSFGARITAAYGTGLLSEVDLEVMRILKKIRNLFAHNIKLSFRDDKVISRCNRLEELLNSSFEDMRYTSDAPGPREIFQSSIAYYSGSLNMRLRLVKDFNVTGGFTSVFKLNIALSDALESVRSTE